MLAKISSENVKALGAKDAAEFDAKLSTFISEATQAKTFMAENQTSIVDLQATIKALEEKLLTEAKVKEISGEAATAGIAAWAGSDAGKKIIGAEASRIAMEALANVGTQPAKPAPAAAGGETPEQKASGLMAAGKFEEAYALSPTAQKEFLSAKSYAAFCRNANAVRITTKN